MTDEKRREEEKQEIEDKDLDKVSGGTRAEPQGHHAQEEFQHGHHVEAEISGRPHNEL